MYLVIKDKQAHIDEHIKKRNIFVYKDGEPWCKKSSFFHVTIESFDGAKICDLQCNRIIPASITPTP